MAAALSEQRRRRRPRYIAS